MGKQSDAVDRIKEARERRELEAQRKQAAEAGRKAASAAWNASQRRR
jgi:hypothetical protein